MSVDQDDIPREDILPDTPFNENLSNLHQKLFSYEVGIGVLYEPNGNIHPITQRRGVKADRLDKDTIFIAIDDLSKKIADITNCKFAILSSGPNHQLQVQGYKTESELGEALHSSPKTVKNSDGVSERLGIWKLTENSWFKDEDQLQFKQTFTLLNP